MARDNDPNRKSSTLRYAAPSLLPPAGARLGAMLVFVVALSSLSIAVNAQAHDQTAGVTSFSPHTCEVTAQVTFHADPVASFVVPPTVPFRDWHWRLFTSGGAVGVDPTSSVHGLPGITINRANPTDGDLALIAAGETEIFDARVHLCSTFSTLPAGQYSADLTSQNSLTDPCDPAEPDECLDHPIRTWEETTPPFSFVVDANGDRFGDHCPEHDGALGAGAAQTGCPNALRVLVILNRQPFDGGVVRVFNRDNRGFQEMEGKNAHEEPKLLAKILFEANSGAVGACITGKKTEQTDPPVPGQCEAGLAFPYNALAIVKVTLTTGETLYAKSPFGPPHDYKKDGVATKQLTVKQ
jgi:hypothetical protein